MSVWGHFHKFEFKLENHTWGTQAFSKGHMHEKWDRQFWCLRYNLVTAAAIYFEQLQNADHLWWFGTLSSTRRNPRAWFVLNPKPNHVSGQRHSYVCMNMFQVMVFTSHKNSCSVCWMIGSSTHLCKRDVCQSEPFSRSLNLKWKTLLPELFVLDMLSEECWMTQTGFNLPDLNCVSGLKYIGVLVVLVADREEVSSFLQRDWSDQISNLKKQIDSRVMTPL